jgi:hypothetical protein
MGLPEADLDAGSPFFELQEMMSKEQDKIAATCAKRKARIMKLSFVSFNIINSA